MSWWSLRKTSQIFRQYLHNHKCVTFSCSKYHSREGVFGCKPQQDGPVYQVSPTVRENRVKEGPLYQLTTAYRKYGHRKAELDLLKLSPNNSVPELDASIYGLSADSTQQHNTEGILHGDAKGTMSTQDVVQHLENMYCGPISAEFEHIPNQEEREWFAEKFEQIHQEAIPDDRRVNLGKLMLKSQAFDNFLASKFTTVKRYGGEGAESAMVFYDELFKQAANYNIDDVIVCIAHRGRLNLLTCLLEFPPATMFKKMKGQSEFPPDVVTSGDVLSHLISSVDLNYDNKKLHVTLLPNSSHLEAINPVAMGKTRSRQQSSKKGDYSPESNESRAGDGAMCLMIHGDASFAGQGILQETFALSSVPHFNTGGSVHLIINNQIGFTTSNDRGNSSHHCSDVGKMIDCPVIHVNGDYPEEVARASALAMAYRDMFRKDIIIDYVCYRRWGHNEMDEPAFTQPSMYAAIRSRKSIPDAYADVLMGNGICAQEDLSSTLADWDKHLQTEFTKLNSHVPKATHLEGRWEGLVQAPPHVTSWDTGLPLDLLQFIGKKSVTVPSDMNVHPTLVKTHVQRRIKILETGVDLDWATAEALAMGSLLYQGYNVRICGQDVGRGTFSHRHAMLVNQDTEAIYVPLNHITDEQNGFLEIANSILSEEAVLGFEYGISIENPKTLAIWEAQFGDFFNGAQIVIDTLISSGEIKWLVQSGLVLLLPHGLDGAGPEHSSCRMERFLQLTSSSDTAVDGDNINMQVANPSTPAQYYHLLRRQMVRNFRKPLVVVAPKTMLRHADCTSKLAELAPGTTFTPVLGDSKVNPKDVKRVVVVTGKHYYTLAKERESRGVRDMALVRLESLCPFPTEALRNEFSKYSNATDFVWAQEEHRNQGAWSFVSPRFSNVVGQTLRYVGRDVSCTPATGIGEVHQREKQQLMDDTFAAV